MRIVATMLTFSFQDLKEFSQIHLLQKAQDGFSFSTPHSLATLPQGVLPTGWPPTLAPQSPQLFEGILAFSPLDVSDLCAVLTPSVSDP